MDVVFLFSFVCFVCSVFAVIQGRYQIGTNSHLCNFKLFRVKVYCNNLHLLLMDPPTGMDDSSTDDDAASQTTEDDPQVPENQESAPLPAPPVSAPASRERPHYELRHTIHGHTKSLSAVKFSHDGVMLASCGSFQSCTLLPNPIAWMHLICALAGDTIVKIWSPFTGALIRNLTGHTKGISDVAWSSDNIYLASGSDDTNIRIWEVDSACIMPSNF